VRVMLVTLLPAFWLVAADSGTVGTSKSFADGRVCTLVSDCDQGRKGPWSDAFTLEQKARHSTRRFGSQTGLNGSTPGFAVAGCESPRPERFGLHSVFRQAPAELAGCWQFYWRTALEPRAPTSVS
jgi:hypothetical protein